MTKPGVICSYAVLFVVGIIASYRFLKLQDFCGKYSFCTFSIITHYGFLGLLVHSRQASSAELITWLDKTRIFVDILAIPCYTTDLCLKYGILQHRIISFLYTWIGCILPLTGALNDQGSGIFFNDGLIYAFCTTISAISCQNGNSLGVLGPMCFMIGRLFHRKENLGENQNHETAFNLFTTAFVVCAMASLKTPKIPSNTCRILSK